MSARVTLARMVLHVHMTQVHTNVHAQVDGRAPTVIQVGRAKKYFCVFRATVSKKLGKVGIEFCFLQFFFPKIPVKTAKNQ